MHDGAEHGDLGGRGDISRTEERTLRGGPRPDQRQVYVGALNLRAPIEVARHHLAARVHACGDVLHAAHVPDRGGIVRRQRAGVALAGAHAGRHEVAGAHHDHVGARRLDLRLDRRLGAGAERDHGDDGTDADDHAKHGQRRAHLVASQRLEGDPEDHQDAHGLHRLRFNRQVGKFISRHAPLGHGLIGFHEAVAKRHDARAVLGNVVLMGDQDDRDAAVHVQALEQAHHLDAGPRIKVTGGFVGQDDRRIVHQRASNGHALLLTTR